MKANENVPETIPQASPAIESRSSNAHERMLCGYVLTLRGNDAYFQAIEAQVDLALSRQNGARQ
jgi:hypothetical protein